MRRAFPAVLLSLAAVVLFIGCPTGVDPVAPSEGGSASLSQSRTFRAQRATDGSWYDVPATLRASGSRSAVYVEDAQTVSIATAQAIASEFDDVIHPLVRSYFGTESDVDGNGKTIILLLDIVDGYTGSGGYVAGYFDPTHVFDSSVYANSNEADMIFMDVDPLVVGSQSFHSTVAHEFQHLVNFANTYLDDFTQQDIWINEGLSSGAEYLYLGGHDAGRVSYYNDDLESTIEYGNTFYVWNGYWEDPAFGHEDVLANYATVYLFFQWLRIHASNGAGIYGEILASPFRDRRAVTSVASSRIDGSLADWSALLGTWLRANILNEATGLYGYGGEISHLEDHTLSASLTTWPLSSGEGLNAASSGTFNPGGGGTDVVYNGIDTSTGVVDENGADGYTGDLFLAYNANTIIAGSDQTAYLPDVQTADLALLRSLGSNLAEAPVAPESYRVDFAPNIGGGSSPRARGGASPSAAGEPKPVAGK